MQQKMMKYMMIFMAVMFYKVPSGPGHLLHHQQPLADRRAAAAAQDCATGPSKITDDEARPGKRQARPR